MPVFSRDCSGGTGVPATSDRSRETESGIWARLIGCRHIGCAVAICFLIAPSPKIRADDSGGPPAPQRLRVVGDDDAGGLHQARPVVTAVPERDPQPLQLPEAPSGKDFGALPPPAVKQPQLVVNR